MDAEPVTERSSPAPTRITSRVARSMDVARAWTVRTLRARYQQSALGWSWAILQPVATVAIFTLVFTRFVPIDTGTVPYVLFSYAAVAPWALLANALPDMAMSLVNNLNLVTKIAFPREALPVSALAARIVDFGISLALLVAMVVAFGIAPTWAWPVFLPIIVAIEVVFALGLGLGLAALNVFYRDVDPVLKLTLQLWFYASPIIYPVTLVPARWQSLYFLNPMAGVIEGFRDVLLEGSAPGAYLWTSAVVAVIVLAVGYVFFRRTEGRFADII